MQHHPPFRWAKTDTPASTDQWYTGSISNSWQKKHSCVTVLQVEGTPPSCPSNQHPYLNNCQRGSKHSHPAPLSAGILLCAMPAACSNSDHKQTPQDEIWPVPQPLRIQPFNFSGHKYKTRSKSTKNNWHSHAPLIGCRAGEECHAGRWLGFQLKYCVAWAGIVKVWESVLPFSSLWQAGLDELSYWLV